MRKISTAIVALATLALAPPASAAHVWLNGSNYTTSSKIFTGSDGVNVRVSAWSIDYDGIIRSSTLGVWDYGLGVSNGSGDNSHTVDNSGWNDFLLFQFDQSVELENGWFWSDWHDMYDTDATIGYGTTAFPYNSQPGIDGLDADLVWAGTGTSFHESNDGTGDEWGSPDDSYRNINPLDRTGNFWLVGASFDSPDRYFDGFKLKKLTYSVAPPPPSVPEPGTWLMMILGFGLVGGVMRREKRKDAPALA